MTDDPISIKDGSKLTNWGLPLGIKDTAWKIVDSESVPDKQQIVTAIERIAAIRTEDFEEGYVLASVILSSTSQMGSIDDSNFVRPASVILLSVISP